MKAISPIIKGEFDEEAEFMYQRITHIHPVSHRYEKPGEKPYIKYGCPVCESLGNRLGITPGTKNCPLCNVNLYWGN